MIKIAIAGCGSITRLRHAPEYCENPNAEIVGFFDALPSRAQELADQFGGKVYPTYNDLLEDTQVQAVSICTANLFHAPMSIQALEAGKHVLCEKPMAQTAEEAKDMIRAAEGAGRVLMVGHNQRLTKAHQQAKRLIANGEIGRVLTFKTCFGHAGPESWGIDKSSNTWFFDKNFTSVGSLGDLGVHKIDLIRFLLDDEFLEVTAVAETLDKCTSNGDRIGVDDNVFCILRTRSGVIGSLTNSWTYYGEEDNSTILYGTEGIMKIYQNHDFPIELIKRDGSSMFYQGGLIATNKMQVKSGVIDAFVEALVRGSLPPITGWDGLRSIEVVNAILQSAQTKRTVQVTP